MSPFEQENTKRVLRSEQLGYPSGWKTVLLLQFEPQFQMVIYTGIIISYIFVMVDFAHAVILQGVRTNFFLKNVAYAMYIFDIFYLLDLLLMTIFKKIEWPEVKHMYHTRHGVILLFEYVSLIALEQLFHIQNVYFFYYRMRYVYRMVRVFLLLKKKNKIYDDNILFKVVFQLILILSIIAVTAACVIIPIVYAIDSVGFFNVTQFYVLFYTTTSRLTSKGFGQPDNTPSTPVFEYVLLCTVGVAGFILSSSYTCKIAYLLMPKMKYQFSFAHNYMLIAQHLSAWKKQNQAQWKNYHRFFRNTVIFFLRFTWRNVQSTMWKDIPRGIIPYILIRDITLDVSWDAFKHSHLFRHQSTSFLRYLCTTLTYSSFLPGEIVFRKNKNKSTMIYIVSGIIQVISEENSETPVLSLSCGTCMGESTLITDYPAKYTVVSKTYCEVVLLKRKNFIMIAKDHPEIYHDLIITVQNRYKQALEYWKLRKYKFDIRGDKSLFVVLPLSYIKCAIRRILNEEYDFEKSRVSFDLHKNIQEHIFCPYYLDLITITEELELISDSVFVKTKFPFIFQPKSVVLKWWDAFIDITSVIFILGYPIALAITQTPSGKKIALSCIVSVTFLWTFDIYVKLSTAIKTRDNFLTKTSDIIYYRLSKVHFIIDLFCVLPFGLLLNFINSNISANMMMILESHKLLKIYRIVWLFNRFSGLNSSLMLIMMYTKVFVLIFVLLYYSSCFLYMLICSKQCSVKYLKELEKYYYIKKNDTIRRFIHVFTMASFFINDTTVYSFADLLESHQFLGIILMQLIYYCIYICLLSKTIAMDTVNQQEKHEFKEFVSTMAMLMKKFSFGAAIEKRVWKYLKDQYYNDMGISFLNPRRNSDIMSDNLYNLYRSVTYGKYIPNWTIFLYTDENLIMDVAEQITVNVYSAGEAITYAGEICKEMHLIIFGYCQMTNGDGETKLLGPKDAFSVTDLCFNIPTMNTVVTCTDCKIISLTLENYLRIISTHQNLKAEIECARQYCSVKDTTHKINKYTMFSDMVHASEQKQPSFRHFKYTHKKSENLTYHKGFSVYTQVFKYILQRNTITPYGNFMFWYECVRCLFAFATNLLTSLINTSQSHISYILVCLDITAWIDVYLMHHVCYFNSAGIEIGHPMFTAIHYWKHSFIIDLLGSLPIDYIFNARKWTVVYLRMNRLLQLRRIFGFFSYLNAINISRTGMIHILKYLPLTVLIMNYIAFVLLHSTCNLDEVNTPKMECAARTMVHKRMKNTTFTYVNAQGASLLMVTSTLTMIGITKFRLNRTSEMMYLSVLVLVGTVFSIWLTAKMVANNFYRNTDLTSYQQAMRDLINFYNYRKIDKNIKKEIIEHYEHMWQKKKGKNIHEMLSYFNTCFKEDLLFAIFGKYLVASPVFPNAERPFFKSLLLEMTYEVYLRRAVIYRVNDIHGKIYLLLCGEIDVLGPDYNKLTTLTSGSIFGNLDNCLHTRQTLMMVATSNVEILTISSVRFHYILSKYSSHHSYFQRLTAFNFDYIESHLKITKDYVKVNQEIRKRNSLYNIYIKINPLHKKGTIMQIWKIFIMVCVDFIGFHGELYQKVSLDFRTSVIVCFYLLDVLYLAKIYLKFHTSYKDDYGMIIRDRRSIAFKYINNKLGFYIDIISTIPFEVISLFFIKDNIKVIVFTCCRINRTLRVILVCIALKNTREKLYVNVVIMRILLIFTWLTIYIHVCTVLFVHMRSFMRVRPPDYYDKMTIYLTSVYIVAYTSIGCAINNFNITYNFELIVYTVLVTTVGRFIVTLFIAETCATIESFNKSKNLYKQFTITLTQFIKYQDVSLPLVKEVTEYIQLLWIHHRGIHVPRLLEQAPLYLKEATLNAMFGYHLRRHTIIKKCHTDLVRQMASQMGLLVFFPENHIAYKGDIDHCMYFIHEGIVDALSEDTMEAEVVERTLLSGDSFGLIQGLHPRMGHRHTYIVRKRAIINILDREKWIHMLVFFPASKAIVDECLLAAKNGHYYD